MKIKAIEALTYYHSLVCTIGEGPRTTVEIVYARWSDDGERIIMGLDNHCGFSAAPDEEIEVECSGVPKPDSLTRHAEFLAQRPEVLSVDSARMRGLVEIETLESEVKRLRERTKSLAVALRELAPGPHPGPMDAEDYVPLIQRRIHTLECALETYAEWHGPCSDHHKAECEGSAGESDCQSCLIDARVNSALASKVEDADRHADEYFAGVPKGSKKLKDSTE